MTRKSAKLKHIHSEKAAKEKRWKEPENEPFRSLEELNEEFARRKGAAFRSLGELTSDFQQQQRRPRIIEGGHQAMEVGCPRRWGVGVLTKTFEDRGFGFIAPDVDDSCEDIFLHFSDVISGSARDMEVGTQVRYELELDASSGRLRAKSVLPVEAISSGKSHQEENKVEEQRLEAAAPCCSNTYNRDVMLTLFKGIHSSLEAMVAHPSSFDDTDGLRISMVPLPSHRRLKDQEDPYLDDEHLIARLEARLDKECGADAMNIETFGTCAGWSYEEALEANAKLKLSQEIEESTIGASSRQSPSHSEDNTDTSEDGRDRRSSGAEASLAAIKWIWEVADSQAKVLDEHRQAWEEVGEERISPSYENGAIIQVQ